MALHDTLEGFTRDLKALPKQGAERGKFITQHMNHPAFLSALQAHPQGKQVHAQLTSYLNSPANAGPKAGVMAVAKNSDLIFSPEGSPVEYTIEEAAKILSDDFKQKLEKYSQVIENLAKKEDSTGAHVGSGIENIPPLKANPLGTKSEKSEKCEKCGEMHLDKCGDLKKKAVKKTDKAWEYPRTDGSKLASDAKPKVANKDGGAGGEIDKKKSKALAKAKVDEVPAPKAVKVGKKAEDKKCCSVDSLRKSAKIKKNEPPMAKPPSGKSPTKMPMSQPKAPPQDAGLVKSLDWKETGDRLHSAKADGKDYSIQRLATTRKEPAAFKVAVSPSGRSSVDEHKETHVGTFSSLDEAKSAAHSHHSKGSLEKGLMSSIAQKESQSMGAPAKPSEAPVKLPGASKQAERANSYQSAMSGAFQPKGPVVSGLELDKPKAKGPAGAKLGLASPKAAGAAPAKPKPGIFGRLFGKSKP